MIRRTIKFVIIFLGLILMLWSVLVGLIATPEVLTPQVVNILQQYTKSEVSIKSVDLSLFNRFPNITLRIDSLRITQTRDSISDLIFARQCRIAVNPIALITNKHIVVNHASLRDASIYLYVDSLNGPIKTFILPEASEQTDSTSSMDMGDYRFSLKRLKIDSTQITIDDRTKEFYTRIDNLGVDVSMNISSSQSDLDVVTGFSNLIVWHKGDLLVKKTSMELRSKMLFDQDSMQLSFDKARIRLNNMDLKARGLICKDTLSDGVVVDIRSSLNIPSLSEFLALIPASVVDNKDQITTEGEVTFDIELHGLYSDTSFPTVSSTLKVDNAKAKYESRKVELEEVDCDAYMFVDFNTPQNSYAEIKRLYINTSDILELNVSGFVTDALENPSVDLAIETNFNFDRFTEVFPLNEGIVCSGTNVSNIKTQFNIADVQNSNYADLYVNGESTFHNLEIFFDPSKFAQDTSALAYLYMQAEKGQMLFGDNVQSDTDSRTLRSKSSFQDLSYKSKSGEYIVIKDVELMAGANFDRTTSDVNGFGIRAIAKNTNVGVDTLFDANLEVADINFRVIPKNEQRAASLKSTINSQQITIRELNYESDIKLSAVDIELSVDNIKTPDAAMNLTVGSQKISVNEPMYNSTIRLLSVDLDLLIEKNEEQNWGLEGSVAFSNFGMFTDLFPINIAIPETSISMSNRTIYLDKAHLKLGDSEMIATGSIHNLVRKLFIEPRIDISGELAINAPSIDFGQIFEASNRSVLLLEEEDVEDVDSPSLDSLEMQLADSSVMFMVPRRVNFVFDLNIDKALFWDAEIAGFEGRATIKNSVLSIDKLSLDAIGAKVEGSIVYRNIDRKSSNLAANMSLNGVEINRIGELLPSINSMFPMFESLEGTVDFDVKANTNIDSRSQIIFSTLYSTMRFKGKDLVLMDGETFADISKTLMFKNKDRNLIDSVEVYALVAESKIDVLPFSMSIDRYNAIIGGSQEIDPETFDIDYGYNISIVKSPLPFKAGVDITGNLEDFKFKVTKAKLKNTDFDEQRMIYEEYRNSIDASANDLAEELEAKRTSMRDMRRKQRSIQEAETEAIETELESDDELELADLSESEIEALISEEPEEEL